jgi:GH18 family chitinase
MALNLSMFLSFSPPSLLKQVANNVHDFSWEFPGIQPSGGCNVVSSDDSANFLAFLQQLRRNPVTSKITLSAAVDLAPWVGHDGLPMADVSAFALVLDYICILCLSFLQCCLTNSCFHQF